MAKDEVNEGSQPLKQAQTNPIAGSKVQVEAEHSPLLFFRPETGEIIAVPAKDRNALVKEIGKWNSNIATLHAANQQVQYLDDLISKLALVPVPLPPNAREEAERNWEMAIAWQQEVAKAVRTEIASLDKIGSSGKKLVELIPIPGKPPKPNEAELGFDDLKLSYEKKFWTPGKPWNNEAKKVSKPGSDRRWVVLFTFILII